MGKAFNKALKDCKQRSLTVSNKAPTVSKKLPPSLLLLSSYLKQYVTGRF